MKKIASHIKTTATDFGDMVGKSTVKPGPNRALAQADALYDKHYIVDDLQAGTVARKAAVQLGLLLDDGVDLLIRANPARLLRKSAAGAANTHRQHHDVRYRQKIDIHGADGTRICANLFAPQTANPEQVFPAIILINSWMMDKHQYVLQARRFARNGYIVLSYSARGWGKSSGFVDVGGPNDMSDLSAVIDWLIGNAPVDPDNIGTAGISYGSGLSLLGAAHDERIKTVVCMSGWANLLDAFWSQQTPREVCAKVLVTSSDLAAKTDDQLSFLLNSLIKNQNMKEVKAWAKERSPATYLAKYNKRKPPVYLIQNFQDELFQPNSVLEFYSKLKGPKRIDLNMGTHASAEMTGMLGLKNHLWQQAHAWFDHWLMAVPNDIMEQPPVTCQFERHKGFQLSLGKDEGSRRALEDWPSKSIESRRFYLGPATGSKQSGQLSPEPEKPKPSQTIYSALGTSKSTAGLPFVSSTINAHLNMPLKLDIAKINRKRALVFQSNTFFQPALILGAPELNVRIETTRPQVQLIAYLYEANAEGRCRLITHGPVTRHSVRPNKPFDLKFELVTTCYEVQEGHHLVLVIDTSDLQYKSPTKDDFEVTFHYDGNAQPTFDVPFAALTPV
jgi:predicted acyl esterase